jgi:catechol 2,3-dioxygenase-like lactoylglutathione lyase family enzyme
MFDHISFGVTQLEASLKFYDAALSPLSVFYQAAIAQGGSDAGAPGLRAQYHPHYYAAYVYDRDGYKLEAVCHQPE